MLPQCPEELPFELVDPVISWAKTWLNSDVRPRPSQKAVSHWDKLIKAWALEPGFPLFVRRFNDTYMRGSLIRHVTGRILIPTDNTPSHWMFHEAYHGELISLEALSSLLEEDRIPIAMMLKREEQRVATKKCIGRKGLVNDSGWKLCHIEPVKIGRGDIVELPIEALIQQHIRFLSPGNMFVVPKVVSGLGELPVVIDTLNPNTKN